MRWIIACSLLAAPDARANDGFYQGSAFSAVPVKMSGVAVVREKLVIEPIEHPKCYKLVGVPSKDKKECYARMNLKPLPSCQTNPATGRLDGAIFAPHWRAHAEYEVTASRDIVDAQMGFPIPNWDHSYQCDKADGREDALTDGITDFHVWRNGTEIKGLRRGSLKAVPNLMLSEGAESYAGYLWKTGFKKGEKSSFVVDYAFGLMYNAEFFSRDRQPQQYGESQSVTHFNEKPWFLTLPKSCPYAVASVDYILTPINLWGDRPPEEIRIELKASCRAAIWYLTIRRRNVSTETRWSSTSSRRAPTLSSESPTLISLFQTSNAQRKRLRSFSSTLCSRSTNGRPGEPHSAATS